MPEAPPLADATVLELVHQFRLQFEPAQNAHVLLFPEGMIKLSGSAGEIMRRVDGAASVAAIVADLQQAFPGAELRADVVEFLHEAQRKGWIRVKQPQ
jgi:pyrroloquinoline quinone biosynthesis protein D